MFWLQVCLDIMKIKKVRLAEKLNFGEIDYGWECIELPAFTVLLQSLNWVDI